MSGISSILSVVRGGGRPSPERAYIVPLASWSNDDEIKGYKRYFQYFPESVTDNKSSNFETKVIPGLSHPLYQWTSGGERVIGFTAVFTRDEAPTKNEINYLTSIRSNKTPAVIAGAADAGDVGRRLSDPRNVDIPSAIAWLRSFLYPGYFVALTRNSGTLGRASYNRAYPPNKLILGLPGLRLNAQHDGNADEVCCFMTQCDVTYEAFFSDGTPRLARVQLQFAETIQKSGKIRAHDAFALREMGTAGYRITMSNKDKKG